MKTPDLPEKPCNLPKVPQLLGYTNFKNEAPAAELR